MNDSQVRFTIKDVLSLGTIVAVIAIQWGFNSVRIATAEERIVKVESSDKEQERSASDVKVKLTSIEKDVAQLRKDSDEAKQILNKVLEELRKK